MKSNTFFKLFIIFVLALLLRTWFIDKPEGLWNDEYVSWFIAQNQSLKDMISAMFANCHMPFYYIYIKLWLLFAPDTDLSLRYSSVIPSVISIFVIYACCKEFSDKKTALICSFLTAVSSFNIYFGQEVRPYSLIFLFSTLIYLYFAKILKYNKKFDYILYFLFNGLLVATHTLGIIFCIFNISFLTIYLCKNKYGINPIEFIKDKIIYFSPFILVVLLLTPLMISILFSGNLSQFWSDFSISKPIFVLNDYLTPVQTNIINTPERYTDFLFVENKINNSFLFFSIIPFFISLYGIFCGYKFADKYLKNAFFGACAYFAVLILFSILGKMVLITKYTTEIYPVLLILLSIGFNSFLKKDTHKIFVYIYFVLCLSYLVFSPNSAPKAERREGNRAAVELIKYSPLKYGDTLFLTYYDKDKFIRYSDLTKHYKVVTVDKYNFNEIIFENTDYKQVIKSGKFIYKKDFLNEHNQNIINYMKEIDKNVYPGQRIGLLFLDNVSFISSKDIKRIASDKNEYEKTSFIFLVFSMLKQNMMYSLKDDYILKTITHAGDWSLYVYEKKF